MCVYVLITVQHADGAKLVGVTYLLTYLLTYSMQQSPPHEKVTGLQLVRKFPTFYGTRMFISTFTSARFYPGPARSSQYSHIPLPEEPP
jgi:hypothetical protein